MRISKLFILGSLALGTYAEATDSFWASSTGGNWNDGANWTTNPVFPNGQNDNATIGGITSSPTVTLNASDISLNRLTIDDSTGITINNTGSNTFIFPLNNVITVGGNHVITAPIDLTAATTDNNLTFTVGSNSLTLGGVISGNSQTIFSQGTGPLILSAVNTLTNSTFQVDGNILVTDALNIPGITKIQLGNSAQLVFNESTGIGNFAGDIVGDQTQTNVQKDGPFGLILSGNVTSCNELLINTGQVTLTSTATGFKTISTASGTNIDFDMTSDVTYNGIISGVGSITKDGAANLTLTRTNTTTGPFNISQGKVTLADFIVGINIEDSGTLGDDVDLNMASGTSFDISPLHSGSVVTLHNVQTEVVTSINLGANNLTINGPSSTIASAISGAGGTVTFDGGIVQLQGNNTYTGGTTITNANVTIFGPSTTGTGFLDLNGATSELNMTFFTGSTYNVTNLTGVAGSSIQGDPNTSLVFNVNTTGTTIDPNLIFNGNYSNRGTLNIFGPRGMTLGGTNSCDAFLANNTNGVIITGNSTLGAVAVQNSSMTIPTGGVLNSTTFNSTSSDLSLTGGQLNASTSFSETNGKVILVAGSNATVGGAASFTNSTLAVNSGSTFTATGPITVTTGGTSQLITVNGTLGGGGDFFAGPNTTIAGTGTISRNSTIGGTLSPGNSIGTIHFVGNQTLASGSTLQIELSPTAIDFVDINGTLGIMNNATVNFVPDPGVPPGLSMQFVNASGGLTGQFTHVTSTLPLFNPTLTYTPTTITVTSGFKPITTIVTTGNAGQVAKAIDAGNAPPGSDLAFIKNSLYFLPTTAALNDALNQMQPSLLTAVSIAQEDSTLYVKDTIYNHLFSQDRNDCCCSCNEVDFWLTGFGANTSERAHGTEPGFTSNTPGFAGGMDYNLDRTTRLGVGLGYTHTHFNWNRHRGHANIDTVYGALYGRLDDCCGIAYLQGAVMGGLNRYTTNRHIEYGTTVQVDRRAVGHHGGAEGSAHIRGGLTGVSCGTIFSPYIALDYVYLHENSFHEHKANSLNLHVKGRNSDLLSSEAGLDISHPFCCGDTVVMPYIEGSIIRESRFRGRHVKAELVGSPLYVTGEYPDRTLGGIVGGVDITFCNGTLSVYYQGRLGDKFHDSSYYAQYSWFW